MGFSVDDIAQSIFQKPLSACTEPELRQFAEAHPYFAPAQLLLACALQGGPASACEQQVQTTSLYFPNRLWLEHVLILASEGHTPEWVEDRTQHSGMTSGTWPEAEVTTVAGPEPETIPVDEPVAAAVAEPEPVETGLPDEPPTGENVVAAIAVPVTPADVTDTNTPAWPEAEDAAPAAEPTASEPATWPADENKENTPVAAPVDQRAETAQTYPTENPMSQPATDMAAAAETHAQATPVAPATSDLVFEPYHTVDYFASQGIRFRDDDKAKDRFSQQLRSFTEWLKVMKRISPAEMAATGEGAGERKVELLAEHSLAERHVITEAMAEVWAKQGNRARAEEIYRKLSLLEPAKSSYFAAKIEELKK